MDELSPNLAGEYVPARETHDGQRPWAKLTNQGPLDLDHVDVTAVPANRAMKLRSKGSTTPRRDCPRP